MKEGWFVQTSPFSLNKTDQASFQQISICLKVCRLGCCLLSRESNKNSADAQQHAKHSEPLIERIFEHHHNHKQEENSQSDKKDRLSNYDNEPKTYDDYLKKDEEALKKYYEEDKDLKAEGRTDAGLM
jgi:hypothetical protein